MAGLGESALEQRIKPIYTRYSDVNTTILAAPGEIQIHLRMWTDNTLQAEKTLDEIDTLQSLGHSVGKWEGDTLVVDVIGLSDYTWVGNQAGVHSDQLHIVERFTMLDADTIEWKAFLEDPKAWTKPWNTSATLKRRPPGDALMEYNCAENNKQDDFPTADKLVR